MTNKSLSLCLVLAALAASPDVSTADSWTSFRGVNGTGRALGGIPPGDGPLSLEVAWQRPLGSGYSGLSVVDDRLVTAMAEGSSDIVVALDIASGAELWRYDLAPTYAGHDGSHDGPIATPAVAGGRVFMLGPWGHLAALDVTSGAPLWTAHLAEDLGCEVPYYGFGGSPAVVGDLVVVQVGGTEGALAAFDAASGRLRWRTLADPGDPGAQSPIVAEIGGRTQVLALVADKVAGLDPIDGTLLWQLALDGESGEMGSYTQSPLPIDDRRILVKHQNGEAVVIEVAASAEGMEAKIVASGRGLARSYSPPTLAGDLLYGYSARMLSAVDPDSGELLWRSRDPGDGFLISVDDQLVVVAKTGSLHLGAANAQAWRESSRVELFSDLAWTPPSYADGAIYVRSLGEVARVDLVRIETPRVADAGREGPLPAALKSLAEQLAAIDDPAPAIDAFLAGRELPLIDGDDVLFLWRGEARDVAVAGDMIGMRREEPMRRLDGTDLWWWTTHLDPRARMSYVFFVDDAPAIDPTHQRTTSTTVLGPDMNWFRGQSLEMSWFAMPQWPGLELAGASLDPTPAGRLESIEIALQPLTPEGGETPDPVTIPVHVWLPPGYDESAARYPVVYVHNTGARETGDWPRALDRVVGRTVEPLIAVFPEPPRMRGFGNLFVEQLVPAIDARYRTEAEREARANVGMGWPGFSASLLTFRYHDTFGRLGVQSLFLLEEELAALRDVIGDADGESVPLEIYLEWGRWDLISPHEEMNMRESSRLAWELFREKKWQPLGGEVWDSTDFASWSNRTGVLLEALFPLGTPASELAAWQTGR